MDDNFFTDTDARAPSLARADLREMMLDASEQLGELHRATLRLGDAIVAAGWPGPEWRSRKASLSRLDADLPDNTLDELITRLTELAVNTGPAWLHGNARDLDAFQEEVVILGDVVHPLRRVAQHLRTLPVRERGDLPSEQAFGHAMVAMPLDRLAAILRELERLAPRLAPLTPEEWQVAPTPAPARERPEPEPVAFEPPADVWPPAHSPALAQPLQPIQPVPRPGAPAREGTQSHSYTRLRDFAPSQQGSPARTSEPSTRDLLKLLGGRIVRSLRQLRHPSQLTQRQRWGVSVGLVVVLGLAVLGLTRVPHAHPSALVATPEPLTLKCAAPSTATTLMLRNPGKSAITWQIQAPTPLSITPAQGTLASGQSVALRISASGHAARSGSMSVAASDGTLVLPYTIACP